MTIADFFAAGAEHAGMQGLLVVQDDLGFAYLDPASPTADARSPRGAADRGGRRREQRHRRRRRPRRRGQCRPAAGDGRRRSSRRPLRRRRARRRGRRRRADRALRRRSTGRGRRRRHADRRLRRRRSRRRRGRGQPRGRGGPTGSTAGPADTLRASGGSNALHGGDGDDLIVMVAGANVAGGGTGDDRINFLGGSADIDGGTGDDRIDLAGGPPVSTPRSPSGRESPLPTSSSRRSSTRGLQAEDFTLSIAGTGDRLTVEGGIRQRRRGGADAAACLGRGAPRVADLLAQPRSGTGGNDTLVGTAGNDFLSTASPATTGWWG
ncbi:MAG: hypothetical protein IPG28_18730 [Betaproteobacteria bacterium]|nr:hypothetical protein [Betaproteobacteria bacterium]